MEVVSQSFHYRKGEYRVRWVTDQLKGLPMDGSDSASGRPAAKTKAIESQWKTT